MWTRKTALALLVMALVVPSAPASRKSNILLIIGDDMGIDSFALYNDHPAATFPPTPHLDGLAARGVLFRNAYANPVCSPTRAAIITGRHGYRTGVMKPGDPLSPSEYTLPEVFADQSTELGYELASFGKWHLAGGALGPNIIGGWPHFAGSLEGAVSNFRRWEKVVNGVTTNLTSSYATRVNTTDAINWVRARDTNTPWFAWVGYNASHTPLHKPPNSMHSYDHLSGTDDDIATNARPYFEAMTEAMDFQIGRLLEAADTNSTTVIFIGDNGTASNVIQPPYDIAGRAKGSVYEGGTHVPMIVAGPDVVNGGRTDDSVVHCADLFATIIELAGGTVPGTGLDSRSLVSIFRDQPFLPAEACILVETDRSKYNRAIRNDQYKLLRQGRENNDEFYDMLADPLEGTNLLDGAMDAGQQAAYDALFAKMAAATNPMEVVEIPTNGYPIVDTSQADCYDDQGGDTIAAPPPGTVFAGQDAQYWGLSPSYRDNDDGTVTDLNTGLMWQQTPDLVNQSTWTDAVDSAASLTLGGHGDWRLPTVKELYSLIDFTGETGQSADNAKPYLDTNYFHFVYGDTNVARHIDAQYWTDTEYVHYTMNGDETVFGVNFADGRIKGYPKWNKGDNAPSKHFVRYVRGNTQYGVNDFSADGNGTVTDFATGLMWQRGDSGTTQNWEQALAYAEGLELAGYADWRLPNAKELQSIVDYTRSPMTTASAAIDTNYFDVTETESFYWTSTTHLDGAPQSVGNYAVYLSFGRALGWMEQPQGSGTYNLLDVHGAGAQRSDPKSGTPITGPPGHGPQGDILRIYNYVRCVRSGAEDVSIDSDGDSLSDWYEHNYTGNATGMDPAGDDDGDGVSNRDEERSGTVPTDGASRLAMTHVASASPTGTVIRWRSELGQSYRIDYSTNLLSDAFGTVVAKDIPATPPENAYTHTGAGTPPQRFYRVRTR
jgi:arylsulfatase A-like enzyme